MSYYVLGLVQSVDILGFAKCRANVIILRVGAQRRVSNICVYLKKLEKWSKLNPRQKEGNRRDQKSVKQKTEKLIETNQ